MWSEAEALFPGVALALLIAALTAGGASASEGATRGPALLKMDVGARAAGLGGAFVGLADDASALYWNPAAIGRIPEQEVLFMHTELTFDQTQDFLGYVRPVWWGRQRRTLGASYSARRTPGFDVVESGQTEGRAEPTDQVVQLTYQQPLGTVSLGISLKGISQKVYQSDAQGAAVDIGLAGSVHDRKVVWGVALANAGGPLRGGDRPVPLATVVRAGGAASLGSHWTFSGQLDAPLDNDLVYRLGTEYSSSIGKGFRATVRAGLRTDVGEVTWDAGAITVGAGIEKNDLRINLAYAPSESEDATSRIDLAYRFGGPLPQEVQRDQWVSEARRLSDEGKLVKAQEAVTHALALSPGDTPARQLAKEISLRFSESVEPETLFTLGHHAFSNGEYDRAVDFFRKLLVVDPAHGEAALWLKKAETKASEAHAAQVKIEVERNQARERQRLSAEAETAMSRKEWSAAMSLWQRIERLGGDVARARAGYTHCRNALYEEALVVRGQDKRRARDMLSAVQSREPYKDAAALIKEIDREIQSERAAQGKDWFNQGLQAYKEGALEKARALFQKAVAANPEDSTAQRALERVEGELAPTGQTP